MNERNVDADLEAIRKEAGQRLQPVSAGASVELPTLSVARAAELAEVTRRNWQRWEKRGSLPKAVLDRFWRRVDDLAAKRKGTP